MHWSELSASPAPGRRIAIVGTENDAELTTTALLAANKAVGSPFEITKVECANDEFSACVKHLTECGFEGVSVCNPFKADAAKAASQFFIVKQGLGVANALKLGSSVYAQNTEVAAFSSKVRDLKPGLALVMGSGRAARSAVMALFDCGWRIRVWNRNVIKSRPFAIAFETYGKVEIASSPDPVGCSLVINATPLGAKAGEQPPVKWSTAQPRTMAIDFVYRHVATEFLRSAAQRGFKTIDGRELLVEQAAQSLEWWLGSEIPREPMFEAIGFHKLG